MKFVIEDICSVYEYESERMSWKSDGRIHHILSYQLTGLYDHTVNGKVIPVRKDSLFFINKDDPYTVKCHERGRSLCVCFSAMTDMRTMAYSVENDPTVKKLFTEIMKHSSLSTNADRYFVTAKIYELIAIISAEEYSFSSQKDTEPRLKAIKNYLANNYRRADFYVDELAEIAGVGKPQLRKLFKKEYGVTPTQHLIDMRMTTAAHLLDEGHMSISEISCYVGYDDVFYFSRLFKKRFSLSPREYRQR